MRVPANQETIRRAADLLRKGELVAFPTETVYGLGANALREDSVAEIFRVKGRPSFNPLIVHIASLSELDQVARIDRSTAARVELLAERFWPGPLSLVLPKQSSIPANVTAGFDTVAVRVPAHPVAQQLLQQARLPVAAPSANRSDYVSPTTAQHVEECLGEAVPMILDGGACRIGIESTVLSLVQETPRLLRAGAISREAIESILSIPVEIADKSKAGIPAQSPGQQLKHYSPQTPTRLLEEVSEEDYPARVGLIRLSEQSLVPLERFSAVVTLSKQGNLEEVAANLYSALRELDHLGLDLIIIEPCPESGIGAAIMDRIRRAGAR